MLFRGWVSSKRWRTTPPCAASCPYRLDALCRLSLRTGICLWSAICLLRCYSAFAPWWCRVLLFHPTFLPYRSCRIGIVRYCRFQYRQDKKSQGFNDCTIDGWSCSLIVLSATEPRFGLCLCLCLCKLTAGSTLQVLAVLNSDFDCWHQ